MYDTKYQKIRLDKVIEMILCERFRVNEGGA
jgi:hypothetical protein